MPIFVYRFLLVEVAYFQNKLDLPVATILVWTNVEVSVVSRLVIIYVKAMFRIGVRTRETYIVGDGAVAGRAAVCG